jgi:hypothetical protein
MGFTTGAKNIVDILEDIVSGFLNSGAWHNVDTTWNTSVRTVNSARRVLAYGPSGGAGKGNSILSSSVTAPTTTIPIVDTTNFAINDKIVIGTGNTAEVRVITGIVGGNLTVDYNINTNHTIGDSVKELDFEIYMAMEIINQTSGQNYYYVNAPWIYGKGIRVVFSASWDASAHIYPTSNQSTFIAFESCYNCGVSADMATTIVTYYLWIEDNGNGFVIMGKPEPNTADTYQQSFILTIERNPNKEYADGYTNFYLYKSTNIYTIMYDGTNATSIWRDRQILRPFAYQYPDDTSKGQYALMQLNGYGISFVLTPAYYAYKSNGDNKVYFIKPLIHNVLGQITPIFQTPLFFAWSETVGLVDGDIVSIEGQTTKYLCKGLDSPDSGNRLTYAIKYMV